MDKIIYLPQGTGTAMNNLNELLENGWTVVQMSTASENEAAGCFIWIRKNNDNAQRA